METTRVNRPITDAPAPDRPSHLADIGGGRPEVQGATMSNTIKTPPIAAPSSQDAPVYSQEMADAWWTGTQAKLRREWAQMRRPAPGEADLKPLAAYRLGWLSYTAWLWHKVFWDMPGNEETWDGVPFSVNQLREARLVLSDEIHPNVFAALDRVLDDLDHMARTLVEAWQETGTYRGVKFGSRRVPGVGHWDELRLLADRALTGAHPLRPWFDYGAAAGAYQLVLWDYQPDPDDFERLPDIGPLVQQARMLPEAPMQKIPLLRSLVEMAPILESNGQGAFLEEFLGRNREVWGYFIDRADIPTVNAMGFTLDDRVQHGLEHLEPDLSAPWPRRPVSGTVHHHIPSGSRSSAVDEFSLSGWVVDATVDTAASTSDVRAPERAREPGVDVFLIHRHRADLGFSDDLIRTSKRDCRLLASFDSQRRSTPMGQKPKPWKTLARERAAQKRVLSSLQCISPRMPFEEVEWRVRTRDNPIGDGTGTTEKLRQAVKQLNEELRGRAHPLWHDSW